ncbi:MAG: hypothetical protein JRH15_23455, partial [Deltaproteobacteria bacterium]|nr:hypothetical protein [Deltaproteobacteria bacterium]
QGENPEELIEDGLELGEALDQEIEAQLDTRDTLAGSLGIVLDPERDLSVADTVSSGENDSETPVPDASEAPQDIPMETIEAAVARIIEKKLSGTLDELLLRAVEKAVNKEIKWHPKAQGGVLAFFQSSE